MKKILAILIAIMAIAIPTISSSLERTKDKQDESRERVIESAAELYDRKTSGGLRNRYRRVFWWRRPVLYRMKRQI